MFTFDDVELNSILAIKKMLINEGKITCIVGPSGGGKTTLLKLLNKLKSPTKGIIRFQGENLEQVETVQLRREVALLNQHPFIFPGSILDNLDKGLKFHGKKKTEEELNQALKKVKLNKALNHDALTLSIGEQQRLALVRVMVLDAKVILLDEPSSALDEATEQLVIEEVVNYVKSLNKTLVMVTHSLSIAKRYADKIYTIESGKIIEGDAYE